LKPYSFVVFYNRFTALSVVIPLVFQSAFAEPSIELSPRKITVGDPIDLTLSTDLEPGKLVIFPAPEQFAPAEVIKSDTIDASASRRTIRYTISLFEPGEVDLPNLPIVSGDGAEAETLWIDPGQIEVISSVDAADSSSLKDIRPPVKLPWTFREMLPYIIGGLIGLGAAVAAFLWWRKRRREAGEIPEYVPPPLPPDVIAMRKLEDLRVRKVWQDGRIKEFHSELTEILKEYIGALHGFNALEMTSEELLIAREKWSPDEEHFGQMRRIVTLADLVKFAKLSPTPHDHEKSLELAFSYVESTRPVRAPLVEAA
jgi:hypothetical protein